MKDVVFISHATPNDNLFATWLATKLELCGYKVWVDVNNLSPSVDFWNTIDNLIRNEAVKFVFVASKTSVDNSRDGVQKELAIADKIRRSTPQFIVPVRIDDVSFNDFPSEIIRLNAIDFFNNWYKGLTELLKYFEKEIVPKSNVSSSSQYYIDRWFSAKSELRSVATDDEDEYCSNMFNIALPQKVYSYYARDVEDLLKFKHIPYKKNKSVIVTFACNKCLSEWAQMKLEYSSMDVQDALDACNNTIQLLGVLFSNFSKDIISLINWSLGEMMYQKGMRRYKGALDKKSNNTFFFPCGTKSKRMNSSREKALSGKYKTTKNWHFGLSAFYTQFPKRAVIFKWHLVFTDSDGKFLPESSQIAARRRKGRLMFNKQWKECLQASMYYLSSGSAHIHYTSCCEENAMYIDINSERFVAEKSYIEPYVYKVGEKNDD